MHYELLIKREAAEYLRISESCLDRLRAAGKIKSCKLNGKILFRKHWLDQAVESFSK